MRQNPQTGGVRRLKQEFSQPDAVRESVATSHCPRFPAATITTSQTMKGVK